MTNKFKNLPKTHAERKFKKNLDVLKTYEQISTSNYKYTDNANPLGLDEKLLLGMVVRDLTDKDGEVNLSTLTDIFIRIKRSMKNDIRKNGHISKLFQIEFKWSTSKTHFQMLIGTPIGLFKRFMDLMESMFSDNATEENVKKLEDSKLKRWIKI